MKPPNNSEIHGNLIHIHIPYKDEIYAAIIDSHNAKLLNFRWSISESKGRLMARGYVNGKRIYLHRAVMGFLDNANPHVMVDHKDLCPLNCVESNLRICNTTENNRNKTKLKNNKVGIKGVRKLPNKKNDPYRAEIRCDGRYYHLGFYGSAELAEVAYKVASRFLHGEFGRAS